MKNRLFSALIILVMMVSVLTSCAAGTDIPNPSPTVTAVAQGNNQTTTVDADDDKDSDIWANIGSITLGNTTTFQGSGISVNGQVVTITAGGDYTVTGTLTDGMITVNTKEKVKLRLNGVNITNSSGPAIFFEDAEKAYITLTEGTENRLTDGSTYSVDAKGTIFSNDTLEIKGSGTLYVSGNSQHGIASDDDIIIENGTINVTATKDGIHANNNVTVSGGNISITATSDGIESEVDVVIGDGALSIAAGDDGIHAETELTINGGKIDVTKSNEGIEGKTVITVNGGEIRINATDDAVNAGINLTINDGYIYAECDSDGLDSNGGITINGGTTIVFSGSTGSGPVDLDARGGYELTINGGTLIAAGGNMAVPAGSSSTQHSVLISGALQANALVNIASQDGSEIATFMLPKSNSSIIVSSEKLVANTTYNVSTGGSSTGSVTDGLYSGGAYTGGTALGSFTTSAISSSVGQAGGMDGAGSAGDQPRGTGQ